MNVGWLHASFPRLLARLRREGTDLAPRRGVNALEDQNVCVGQNDELRPRLESERGTNLLGDHNLSLRGQPGGGQSRHRQTLRVVLLVRPYSRRPGPDKAMSHA